MSTSTSAARCSAGSWPARRAPARAARRRTRQVGRVARSPAVARPSDPRSRVSSRSSGSALGPAYLRGAQPVEAGVDHDPVQPGRDGGLAAERPGPAVRRDQAVLQPVGGVLGVAHGAQRDRPEPVAVPGEEHAEGVGVAGDVRGEQLGVGRRSRSGRRQSPADHHLGDLAAEAAGDRRERGEPDGHEATGDGLVEVDVGAAAASAVSSATGSRPATAVGAWSVT